MKVSEIEELIDEIFMKNYEIAKKVVGEKYNDKYIPAEKINIYIDRTTEEFKKALGGIKNFSEKSTALTQPIFKNQNLERIDMSFNAELIDDGEEFAMILLHELIHVMQYAAFGLEKVRSDEKYEDEAYANEVNYFHPRRKINYDQRSEKEKKLTMKIKFGKK
jgi:hypothetical protein